MLQQLKNMKAYDLVSSFWIDLLASISDLGYTLTFACSPKMPISAIIQSALQSALPASKEFFYSLANIDNVSALQRLRHYDPGFYKRSLEQQKSIRQQGPGSIAVFGFRLLCNHADTRAHHLRLQVDYGNISDDVYADLEPDALCRSCQESIEDPDRLLFDSGHPRWS